MAMEPLSTIMTVQAQPYQVKQNANSFENQINNQASINVSEIVSNNHAVIKETTKSELNKDNKNHSENSNFSEDEKKKIKEYADNINKQIVNKGVLFNVHEDTNRLQITIIDRKTKEVLKEIPPKQFLDSFAKRMELSGFLFDKKS